MQKCTKKKRVSNVSNTLIKPTNNPKPNQTSSPRYFKTSSLRKNSLRNFSPRFRASAACFRTCFAFNFCTLSFFFCGGGGAGIRSPSASNPTPSPAVSFLTRPLSGSRIPSRPGAPRPSLLSGSQPYVER